MAGGKHFYRSRTTQKRHATQAPQRGAHWQAGSNPGPGLALARQQAYPECRGGDISRIGRSTWASDWPWHIQSAVAAISCISDVTSGPVLALARRRAYPECRGGDITHILRDMRASDWPWALQQAYPECRGGDITRICGDMWLRTGPGLLSRHIQSAAAAISRIFSVTCWPRTGLGLFCRHIQCAVAAISRISDVTCGPRTGLGLFSRYIRCALAAL